MQIFWYKNLHYAIVQRVSSYVQARLHHLKIKSTMTETDLLIVQAAEQNQIDPAILLAVKKVEVGDNKGFLDDGRPTILFEGHVFYKLYNKKHPKTNPIKMEQRHPTIYYPYWLKKYYKGGAKEHDRLAEACRLDRLCGLQSASWGVGQIMGFNYKACGCSTVQEFVNAMYKSEESQIQLWINFLKSGKYLELLKAHNWEAFALAYNGPGQVKYYSRLLQVYYEKYTK